MLLVGYLFGLATALVVTALIRIGLARERHEAHEQWKRNVAEARSDLYERLGAASRN